MAKSATKSKTARGRKAADTNTAATRAKRTTPKRAAARLSRETPALKAKTTAQRFVASHLNRRAFKRDGLRPYARYRDLGIAKATGGLAQAHVIRLIPPCTDAVRKRHTHAVELQLVYVLKGWVLKGWIKNEFEGHGEQLMREGTCWRQPPNIKHTVLDYSDDCEMLEIIIPAKFDTVEV
jgi:hypothetical protein